VLHPHTLSAGDMAAYHEARPKSGVYAVGAGLILAGLPDPALARSGSHR